MTKTICKFIPATAAACLALLSFSGAAQQSQAGRAPAITARVDPPAGAQPASSSSGTSAATSTDTSTATPAANGAQPSDASQISNAELMKDMQEMRSEIKELKTELKSRNDADALSSEAIKTYEQDVAALRTAVHPVAGAVTTTGGQEPAPAAAAPTPPEISAETTTKSAPFPGDWTWLNSGGHNSDSPMSTKYFTPEVRFDANYILDYNHPKDDSMGGSTEMFRSDEWQLEQVSVGGDFRIQNVRGRILTMDGLFATTTPRNDASYNRGQWDLANAYKYVSEAWGGYHWDVAHGINVDA